VSAHSLIWIISRSFGETDLQGFGVSKKNVLRLIALGILIVAAILFRTFHIDDYLTLSFIKESHHRLFALHADHRVTVTGAYMLLYITVTALALPGATIMTLAGGALFGLLPGVIIISFASSIGATIACGMSRFVLRDWVQAKFGERFKTIDEGIAREGAFYLFTLRLIPLFPFFMINLLMGLTKMPLRTFYWVSQLGMLAGTIVYVNAGRELGKIDSLKNILSPGLIISFVLLGLFPLVAKKVLSLYKAKKEKSAA